MAQATSVNGNASLALHREYDFPTGAYTVEMRMRVASWSGGNALQRVLRLEGSDGNVNLYLDQPTGEIWVEAGAFSLLASGSPTGWATFSARWTGAPGAGTVAIYYTPDGGSPVTVSAASRGDIQTLQVFGLPWEPSTVSNQVHLCTLIYATTNYSDVEEAAQSLSDVPLYGSVNAFYPMDDASTVQADASGNGNDFDGGVSTGTGQTVSDTPYPEDANIVGDATPAATTAGALFGTAAVVGSCSPTATTAGAVTGLGDLVGASAPTATTAGALNGIGDLAGASLPTATTAGQLSAPGAIVGAASCSAVTAGEIEGFSPGVEGTAAASATTTGALYATGDLVGAAVCTATTAGRVTDGAAPTVTRLSVSLRTPAMTATVTVPRMAVVLTGSPVMSASLSRPRMRVSVSQP
jgi:hypothetical protein